ncbi:MAG TPA: hypothetical protein D7H95_05815 [Candidatus Poseidoniales archaeon]|nr:MAG TPA: hypothetical protein D7H95_05815 [Candidatus Poseidoniales archaeon]
MRHFRNFLWAKDEHILYVTVMQSPSSNGGDRALKIIHQGDRGEILSGEYIEQRFLIIIMLVLIRLECSLAERIL